VVTRTGETIAVERRTGTKPWRLLLVNVKALLGVTSGSAETTPDGTFVTPDAGSTRVEIEVS
jgi:hypothetical protein